ncbi:hypothetical protein ONS95_011432 [Cadophora gregata]|uniref:uncharacterized protein n=1 Tax=Cadophora gregata TaxID=51156 RepID=UPI0026DC1B97|nr:uncharacterized protein ONS95_011432 [Cadophora gregata]KAK0120014.1 hypothetical protein ONS95_011432 [Cadophora gregata]KAK0121048.1 hypothetical protein ONS96_011234 [Cadophora gregata f. sp. sojae]
MDREPFFDYYKALGVSRDASMNDIQTGYKKVSLKHHPDKNNNSRVSTEAFQRINEAKEVLLHPVQRRMYNIKYDQHVAWTLRDSRAQISKCKRKTGRDEEDDLEEKMRKAARVFANKRARDSYQEPDPEITRTGKSRCKTGENFERQFRPNRSRLWTPYQHPDIRIVGDKGW